MKFPLIFFFLFLLFIFFVKKKHEFTGKLIRSLNSLIGQQSIFPSRLRTAQRV